MLAAFLAKQLAHPSRLFGRFVLAPLWNRRNRALNEVVLERLALCPTDRVLEVGFGGGYLLGRMASVVREGFLAGVDVSPAMVAYCARHYRRSIASRKMDLRCAAAEALPYAAGVFTKVCSVNSIFYWQDVRQAVSELHRVLAAQGTLVLCWTCKESLEQKEFAHHGLQLYTPDELRPLLDTAGFQAPTITRHADRHRDFWCAVSRKGSVASSAAIAKPPSVL